MNFREAFDDGEASGIRTRVVFPAQMPPGETRWQVAPYYGYFLTRELAEEFIRATGRTDLVAAETT